MPSEEVLFSQGKACWKHPLPRLSAEFNGGVIQNYRVQVRVRRSCQTVQKGVQVLMLRNLVLHQMQCTEDAREECATPWGPAGTLLAVATYTPNSRRQAQKWMRLDVSGFDFCSKNSILLHQNSPSMPLDVPPFSRK